MDEFPGWNGETPLVSIIEDKIYFHKPSNVEQNLLYYLYLSGTTTLQNLYIVKMENVKFTNPCGVPEHWIHDNGVDTLTFQLVNCYIFSMKGGNYTMVDFTNVQIGTIEGVTFGQETRYPPQLMALGKRFNPIWNGVSFIPDLGVISGCKFESIAFDNINIKGFIDCIFDNCVMNESAIGSFTTCELSHTSINGTTIEEMSGHFWEVIWTGGAIVNISGATLDMCIFNKISIENISNTIFEKKIVFSHVCIKSVGLGNELDCSVEIIESTKNTKNAQNTKQLFTDANVDTDSDKWSIRLVDDDDTPTCTLSGGTRKYKRSRNQTKKRRKTKTKKYKKIKYIRKSRRK